MHHARALQHHEQECVRHARLLHAQTSWCRQRMQGEGSAARHSSCMTCCAHIFCNEMHLVQHLTPDVLCCACSLHLCQHLWRPPQPCCQLCADVHWTHEVVEGSAVHGHAGAQAWLLHRHVDEPCMMQATTQGRKSVGSVVCSWPSWCTAGNPVPRRTVQLDHTSKHLTLAIC